MLEECPSWEERLRFVARRQRARRWRRCARVVRASLE